MSREAKNREVLDALFTVNISFLDDIDIHKEISTLQKELERAGNVNFEVLMASIECTAQWSGEDIGKLVNLLHIFYNAIMLHKGLEEMEKERAKQ